MGDLHVYCQEDGKESWISNGQMEKGVAKSLEITWLSCLIWSYSS